VANDSIRVTAVGHEPIKSASRSDDVERPRPLNLGALAVIQQGPKQVHRPTLGDSQRTAAEPVQNRRRAPKDFLGLVFG